MTLKPEVESFARLYIKQNEGLVLQWYKDSLGYPTVGYGHLITNSERAAIPPQLTLAQAESLFEEDFQEALDGAMKHPVWSSLLADGRIVALIDLAFNMGGSWFKTFFNTTKDMLAGNWDGAATGLLASTYAKQVGVRARRNAYLLRTGLLPVSPSFDPSTAPSVDTPQAAASPSAATSPQDSETVQTAADGSQEAPPQTDPTDNGFSQFNEFSSFSGFTPFGKG